MKRIRSASFSALATQRNKYYNENPGKKLEEGAIFKRPKNLIEFVDLKYLVFMKAFWFKIYVKLNTLSNYASLKHSKYFKKEEALEEKTWCIKLK